MTIKVQRVSPDRSKIELTDDAVARHWVQTLGASREEIAAAIEKVGANPETVRKELTRVAIDKSEASRGAVSK